MATESRLFDLLPDAEVLLELDPQELGLIILRALNTRHRNLHSGANLAGELEQRGLPNYPAHQVEELQHAVLEAWGWLVAQGLLALTPHGGNYGSGFMFVTRRGQRITSEEAAIDYTKGSSLPWKLIHPKIIEASRSTFLRGDYETAVFKAFKEVEIEVRTAGGYSDKDIGTRLMRKAFDPQDGKLSDTTLLEAERQGLSDLAAGAIGSYKNPHSHRTVTLDEPTDAVEMIFLASHLLRIVDSRRLSARTNSE